MNLEADKLAQDKLSEAMSKPVVGEGEMEIVSSDDAHEVADRIHCVLDNFDRHVAQHESLTDEDAEIAEHIKDTLAGFYQRISQRMASDPRSPTPSPQESALREALKSARTSAVIGEVRLAENNITIGINDFRKIIQECDRALSQGREG